MTKGREGERKRERVSIIVTGLNWNTVDVFRGRSQQDAHQPNQQSAICIKNTEKQCVCICMCI